MSHCTGIVLVTGVDRPGIANGLFDTLSPFSITVVDVEQLVISDRLVLTALISVDRAHTKSIDADLQSFAEKFKIDVATLYSDEATNVPAGITSEVILIGAPLLPTAIARVTSLIHEHHGNIESITRKASTPVTAISFLISGATTKSLKSALKPLAQEGIDFSVLPSAFTRSGRHFLILDMDSTLIQQEVIDLLASHAGVGAEVREITSRAMAGEIDFTTSLRERVALLRGLPESALVDVRNQITFSPGAQTLIKTMRELGHGVGVVSGGFTSVIRPLMEELGISHYRANNLEIVDGLLTGQIQGQIVDRAGKAEALRDFAAAEGVPLEYTIAIGDGANDLDMIELAGLGIAYNGKATVKESADSCISNPRLDSALYLMGLHESDIVA